MDVVEQHLIDAQAQGVLRRAHVAADALQEVVGGANPALAQQVVDGAGGNQRAEVALSQRTQQLLGTLGSAGVDVGRQVADAVGDHRLQRDQAAQPRGPGVGALTGCHWPNGVVCFVSSCAFGVQRRGGQVLAFAFDVGGGPQRRRAGDALAFFVSANHQPLAAAHVVLGGPAQRPGRLKADARLGDPHEAPLVGDHRALVRGNDDHAAQAHEDQQARGDQRRERSAQQHVKPAAGDLEAELVVQRFADDLAQRLGAGQPAQEPRVEGRPHDLVGLARAVNTKHKGQQRLGPQQHHEQRHEDGQGRQAPGVAKGQTQHREATEQDHRHVADEVARPAAERLPRGHARHARDVTRHQEA